MTPRQDNWAEPDENVLMDGHGLRVFPVSFVNFLVCWRPRRDLNLCYRRES